MPETITLWTWSVGWVLSLGFIACSSIWAIYWSLKKLRALFGLTRQITGPLWLLAVIPFAQYMVVLCCAGIVAFFLVQQLAFRFSSVNVTETHFVFRTAAGFELARYQRDVPLEVLLARQGKRTGHLVVKTESTPAILSLNSTDGITLEQVQKIILQRVVLSKVRTVP